MLKSLLSRKYCNNLRNIVFKHCYVCDLIELFQAMVLGKMVRTDRQKDKQTDRDSMCVCVCVCVCCEEVRIKRGKQTFKKRYFHEISRAIQRAAVVVRQPLSHF